MSEIEITAGHAAPAQARALARLGVAAIASALGWMFVIMQKHLSYFELHALLLLPLLALAIFPTSTLAAEPFATRRVGYFVPPLLAAVAFGFSAYWDNEIAAKGVWVFDADAMLGVHGAIPYEEYFWFIDHSLLACYWVSACWTMRQAARPSPRASRVLRTLGVLACGLVAYLGRGLLAQDSTFYLGVLCVYMAPVVGLQWLGVSHLLFSQRREWLLGIAVPTLYLVAVDSYAIHRGVWVIASTYTTGIQILGVKLEQWLVYGVTTTLVSQTMLGALRVTEIIRERRAHGESMSRALMGAYIQG